MFNLNRAHKLLPSTAWILIFYIIITITMTYPLTFRAPNTVDNYGDPLLNAWTIAWDARQFITAPLDLYNANNFFPYENTLAFSENLIASALTAAPLLWATGNPILAHNTLLLLSFIISAWGMYLLVHYLTNQRGAAVIAGIIFAFAPYRFGQISHLQLLTAHWLPFVFLYLTKLTRGGKTKTALLFALFFILQSLSCVYYAFYTTLGVALYLLVCIIRAPQSILNRRAITQLLLMGIIIALVLTPFFIPYFSAQESVGARAIGDQQGNALQNFISLPPTSWLSRVPPFNGVKFNENSFFPGIIALLLTILGVRYFWRAASFYVLLTLSGLILSMGPRLQLIVDGAHYFALPYMLFYKYAPGFAAMRVPARLGVLLMLGIAVLAGYGVSGLTKRFPSATRSLIILCLLFSLGEYLSIPLRAAPIETGAAVPGAYHWLAAQPPALIFEYPSVASFWITADGVSLPRLARHQYFSIYHWHDLVMGYSGFYPPLFWESANVSLNFPSAPALDYLRGFGVNYIIVHWYEMSPKEWDAAQFRLASFSNTMTPVYQDARSTIYEIAPTPASPFVISSLSAPPAAPADTLSYAYLHIAGPTYLKRGAEYIVNMTWRGANEETDSARHTGILPISYSGGETYLPILIPPSPVGAGALDVAVAAQGQEVMQTQITVETQPAVPFVPPALRMINAEFGRRILLTHYRLDNRTYRASETIDITLYWLALTDLQHDTSEYVPRLQLFAADGTLVAQRDVPPANLQRPTTSWRANEVVLDRAWLTLPTDLPVGVYQLAVQVYDSSTGENLHIHAPGFTVAAHRLHLAEININ